MSPLRYMYISRETGKLSECSWFTTYCWTGKNVLKLPAPRSTNNSGFKTLLNYCETSWIVVTAYKQETTNQINLCMMLDSVGHIWHTSSVL